MKCSAWLLLLLISLLNLQCGYRLAGRGRNLPAAARTVAIPKFNYETPHHQAEHFVTKAISDEFIKRSGLRLTAAIDQADLILEGRIGSFETAPVAYSELGTVKLHELRITIHVRLIDMKNNDVLYEANELAFRETYESDAGSFFSQAAAALEKIAARFAASAVTAILADF